MKKIIILSAFITLFIVGTTCAEWWRANDMYIQQVEQIYEGSIYDGTYLYVTWTGGETYKQIDTSLETSKYNEIVATALTAASSGLVCHIFVNSSGDICGLSLQR